MLTKYLKSLSRFIVALCHAGLICTLFSCLTAQASPMGKINFEDLSKSYGEPKVEINLSAGLIGMVSNFAQQQDPEVKDLLSKLEEVKVRIYNISADKSQDKALNMLDKVTKNMRKDKWESIITVNEDDERVRIFSKSTKGIIDGLVVMVVNSEEAVFINIVGEIDPSKVSKVTESLNMNFGD